jgi:magnesium transporter
MEFHPEDTASRISTLLASGASDAVLRELEGVPAPDVALISRHLNEREIAELLKLLPEEDSADILAELGTEIRTDVLEELTPQEIAGVVEEMSSDDAADVVAELEEEKAEEVVDLLEEEDRLEISHLLTYPEDTAGGIMQLEVVSVREDRNVARAIEKIRMAAGDIDDDLHSVYVVDVSGKLVGNVPLPRLVLANPTELVRTIMVEDTFSVPAEMDQEEVAQIFQKYDLTAAPVVDQIGRLLGRITVDDIVDVIHEEAEQDYARVAGTDQEEFREEAIYRKAGIRLPWLITGLLGGLMSAFVLSRFEQNLEAVITLAFFVPVITAMGGNAAIQSSAVMVRGLATGEVTRRDATKRLTREMGVALITGVVCATLIFTAASLWSGDLRIGAVVSGSMLSVIIIATTLGAFVPLVLDRLGVDPALATGPFVTTSNDIIGIAIYLSFAAWALHRIP